MNRIPRIAVNILTPPLIAALLLTAFASLVTYLDSSGYPLRTGKFALLAIIYAYMVAFIPSVLHACAMEWVYRRNPPHSFRACLLSGCTGFLSGALIDLFFIANASHKVSYESWMLILPTLGLIVGLTVGFLIKLFSPTVRTTASLEMRGCE